MTVTDLKESADAAQLVAKSGGRRDWACPYLATVDSPTDDALTIVEYMNSIGRGLNSTLTYGSRTDASVWCARVAPTRIQGSLYHWSVVCTYEPPTLTAGDQQGHDGQTSDDPDDWRYQINTATRLFPVPVWQAWNIDPFPKFDAGGGYRRPINTLGPVVNSAGIPYDPPLQTDVPETILRVSGYLNKHYSFSLFPIAGRINEYPLTWHPILIAWYNFHQTWFAPHCVRCMAANASAVHYSAGTYWRYEYEFAIREPADAFNPQDGFLETVLDRGLTRSAGPGDPDGRGGYLYEADIEPGMARHSAIRDADSTFVPELVLLDGTGQPISKTLESTGVYFRWRIHPYADFTSLAVGIFARP